MNVLVLGDGVVGLAAAYYLARDGHEVAVVERNHGVGLETSSAARSCTDSSSASTRAGMRGAEVVTNCDHLTGS